MLIGATVEECAEVRHVMLYFELNSRNNGVSMTTNRTQTFKELLFQQRIHSTGTKNNAY